MNEVNKTSTVSDIPELIEPAVINSSILREFNRRETIIMIYRIAAIAVGLAILYLGYRLFTVSVIDPENLKNYRFEWPRVLPGALLGLSGLIIILMGITKLMPLPGRIQQDNKTEPVVFDIVQPEDGIPVLTQPGYRPKEDLLWKNNVRPLLDKVAGNENISLSDRELLRKWLLTLESA